MMIDGKLAPFYAPGEVPERSCLKCAKFRFDRHCDHYKDGECKQDGSAPVKFVEYPDWLKRLWDMNKLAADGKKWLFTAEEVSVTMGRLYGR